jgi:CRP-like cAMP-binding protein
MCVNVLVHGSIKLSINSSYGRRVIVGVASPGHIIGMASVILGLPYEFAAETTHACKIACIPKVNFLDSLRRHPESSQAAVRELSTQYVEMCETLHR